MEHPVGDDADDPRIRAEIDEALATTDRYGPRYDVVRQAASGSRVNFLLRVEDRIGDSWVPLWCRATHQTIDDAFAARFTLAREAAIVDHLVARSVRVPEIVASSRSGRVLIQQALDERHDATPRTRARHIAAYMQALDAVHDLPAAQLVPAAEVPTGWTAADAVRAEESAWWELARSIVDAPDTVASIERATGLDSVGSRLARIHEHLAGAPAPPIDDHLDFVHGDAGRANYVADRRGVVWLVDWELAHAGSRLEDYAWIELRGLEQDEAVWRREVMTRLATRGAATVAAYDAFRTSIYFRSVIAISARIAAEPGHSFVPYLTHRFRENEQLGWGSARRAAPDGPTTGPRFDAWRRWTTTLDDMAGAS